MITSLYFNCPSITCSLPFLENVFCMEIFSRIPSPFRRLRIASAIKTRSYVCHLYLVLQSLTLPHLLLFYILYTSTDLSLHFYEHFYTLNEIHLDIKPSIFASISAKLRPQAQGAFSAILAAISLVLEHHASGQVKSWESVWTVSCVFCEIHTEMHLTLFL